MIKTALRAAIGAALLLVPLSACSDAADEAPEADDAPAAAPAPEPAEAPAAADADAMLDPDVASREDLLALPGLDEAAVDALIAARPFEDMLAVAAALPEGMGEGERDAVFTRLWRPIDLNGASREEILLIPGVGDRMAHEFEEYRPYRAMAEFRREIGKYVDEAEVARLERYVTLENTSGD